MGIGNIFVEETCLKLWRLNIPDRLILIFGNKIDAVKISFYLLNFIVDLHINIWFGFLRTELI